jgi:asparagine synthase (glutamine-hydrolysing)
MLTTGFTFVAHSTTVEIRPYAQQRELAGRLLSFAQDDLHNLLLMGRLYYRGDQLQLLRGLVDDRTFDQCRQSDATLAQALYKIGGIEQLCRLEGDFVLACHDRTANRLVALRDPLGAYPLFWVHHGETIALSTSIRPLLDLLACVEFDIEYMVDYLAFPTDAFSELPLQHTAYDGVQRLLPGWLLAADLSTRHVACRPYWNWREQSAGVAVGSVEEAGELVRERLEAAVRERLSRHADTGCHFSGGFDSTGVALLAGQLAAKNGKPLHALSLVYQRDPMLAQESEYIQCALEGSAGIIHHVIPADDLLDFVDHQRMPLLDEPSPPLGAQFKRIEALAQTAANAGVDTLMRGDGADHLFAPPAHSFIADLLNKGRVRQALKLATEHSRFSSQSPWRISIDALKLLLPLSVRDGISPLLKGGRKNFEDLSERTIPPWFTDEFIRRHRLRRRILDRQSSFSRSGVITAQDIALAAGDWDNWHIGLPNGVVVCRPYWDTRLVKLALGLPKGLHAKPGQMKPVLAAALHDVLPEKILTRSGKAHFDILHSGLARNQNSLEEIIRHAPIQEGIINRSVLIDSLAKAGMGIYKEAISVGRLRLALSYLMWASTRDDWMRRPVPTIDFCDPDGAPPNMAATRCMR